MPPLPSRSDRRTRPASTAPFVGSSSDGCSDTWRSASASSRDRSCTWIPELRVECFDFPGTLQNLVDLRLDALLQRAIEIDERGAGGGQLASLFHEASIDVDEVALARFAPMHLLLQAECGADARANSTSRGGLVM